MSYLGDLGSNFEMSTLNFDFISKISTLKFPFLESFVQKIKILKSGTKDARFRMKKCLNLGPKIPDLGIFALEFENNIVTFEISTLKFVYLQNFTEKKYLNSGPKIWVCLGWNLTTILSCLKSTPSILRNCEISRKNKNA